MEMIETVRNSISIGFKLLPGVQSQPSRGSFLSFVVSLFLSFIISEVTDS
jgi:hypothetical protein